MIYETKVHLLKTLLADTGVLIYTGLLDICTGAMLDLDEVTKIHILTTKYVNVIRPIQSDK